MYAIIKIAINIYSGTLFIEMAMGWSQYASVIGPVIQARDIRVKVGGPRVLKWTVFRRSQNLKDGPEGSNSIVLRHQSELS